MNNHPATTKIIKPGRSQRPFLLFTGNRKHAEDKTGESRSPLLISLLIAFAAIVIGTSLYLFFTGRLS
jgi:hypothetical protein